MALHGAASWSSLARWSSIALTTAATTRRSPASSERSSAARPPCGSFRPPLWNSNGAPPRELAASKPACAANAFASSGAAPFASVPLSRLVREKPVTLGSADSTSVRVGSPGGRSSIQPRATTSSISSQATRWLMPSSTSSSTGRCFAIGATTRSSTSSTPRIGPPGAACPTNDASRAANATSCARRRVSASAMSARNCSSSVGFARGDAQRRPRPVGIRLVGDVRLRQRPEVSRRPPAGSSSQRVSRTTIVASAWWSSRRWRRTRCAACSTSPGSACVGASARKC